MFILGSCFFLLVTPPSLSISLTPNDIIYESTILVITCNGTLPSVVDTDVTATVKWTGPNGIINNDERIIVDEAVSVGDNLFQSLLTFQPVDNGDMNNETNDEGMYTCEMTISSSESEILSSVNSITEDFNVNGWLLRNNNIIIIVEMLIFFNRSS